MIRGPLRPTTQGSCLSTKGCEAPHFEPSLSTHQRRTVLRLRVLRLGSKCERCPEDSDYEHPDREKSEALVLSPCDLVGSVLLAETPSPRYQVPLRQRPTGGCE